MEATPHTFLVGPAAEEFAASQGLELVTGGPEAYFGTASRRQQRLRWLQQHQAGSSSSSSGAQGGTAAAAGTAAAGAAGAAQPRQDELVQGGAGGLPQVRHCGRCGL